MTKSALSERLDKRARTAARSACLFYDASTGMVRFLPEVEKQRYFVPFGRVLLFVAVPFVGVVA